MKLLLDTHIILWALDDNPKLSYQARNLIMDEKNSIYYSAASVWEVTIKYMAKPDRIHISGSKLSDLCREMGYQMLPISDIHVKALETLVYHSKTQIHNVIGIKYGGPYHDLNVFHIIQSRLTFQPFLYQLNKCIISQYFYHRSERQNFN